MDTEFFTRIARLFATCGVTDYYFERGGKHPRVVARHGSAYVRYAFPGTSGDRRAVLNCIADLRKALNLCRDEKKPGGVRRRTRRTVKQPRVPLAIATMPVAVSNKPTWQEGLAAHFDPARVSDSYSR